MARSSGIGDAVISIIFIWGIAKFVSDVFKIGFGWGLGAVIGVYVCGVLLVLGAGSLSASIKRNKRCAHGVRRGKDGGCQDCVADEERRNADWKARQAVQEQKNAIKKNAAALRASELNTLRRRWLSRSELYLQMTSQQFEDAVAVLFRELGYQVKQTPYSNDRGKDAIALKDGKKYLIECKRYDANNTIGRRDLQVFVAAMKEENAHGGFYINTGRFANTVAEYAEQNQIDIYDGTTFPTLVNSAFPVKEDVSSASVMCAECGDVLRLPIGEVPTAGKCANGHSVTNDITTTRVASARFACLPVISGPPSRPALVCDQCGSTMRLVNGWRGKFWGCSKYPKCKSTKRYKGPGVGT